MQTLTSHSARRMLKRAAALARAAHTWLSRRRRTLWCVATLAAIAMLSSLTAWMLWQATVERRLVVGNDTTDVRDQATLVKAPPERRTGLGTTSSRRRSAPPPRNAAPPAVVGQPSAIPGPALAAASASAALLVGGIAATLVVRRYGRRRPYRPHDETDPELLDVTSSVDAARAPVQAADAAPRPPQGDGDPERATAPSLLRAVNGREIDEVATGGDVDDSPAGGSVGPKRVEIARRHTGVGVAGTGQPEPVMVRGRLHEPGQRLFEKRKAPRIPFDCSGHLQWRAGASEVRIVDLSETGLRCRLPDAVTAQAAPKAPQTVLLAFPVGGRLVDVTARIAWRKTTTQGVDLGLEFTAMSDENRQLLRFTCATATV